MPSEISSDDGTDGRGGQRSVPMMSEGVESDDDPYPEPDHISPDDRGIFCVVYKGLYTLTYMLNIFSKPIC